jgi:UDP-GlcNAc:undecaprenyl-phosphate GlcNAc-1-phosphate transferase
MQFILIFVIAIIISLFSVFYSKQLAIRYSIGSLPSPRKLHKGFKPLLGGIGFITGLLAATVIASIFKMIPADIWLISKYFWVGLIIIVITGIWDDIKGIPSSIKFTGEGLAAIFLIIGGCKIQTFSGPMGEIFDLGIFAIPFTFLWIIFIINAINLLDGLDGLAGGISLIITLGIIIISFKGNNIFLIILGLGLSAGLLAFLRFNYHPASIFMGEAGSLQLGYLMAFFSIETLKVASTHRVYFLVSLIIFAVPLTDTLVSFLRRLAKGQNPFSADKEHIHHRLLGLGLTHIETVWLLYLFTGLYVVLGILMVYFTEFMGLLLFIIGFGFAIFLIWRLGYFETRTSWQNLVNQFHRTISVRKRAPLHFHRIWHVLLVFTSDVIAINFALIMLYMLKFQSGLLGSGIVRPLIEYFTSPAFLLISFLWIMLFYLNDLYFMDWDVSRFEKSLRVTKVITFGILVLAFITLDFERLMNQRQILTLAIYWLLMVIFVNGGRLIIISVEKYLNILEYKPKKTLIIGCNNIATNMLKDIKFNRHLIFEVIGFVSKKTGIRNFNNLPVLGGYDDLPRLIHKYKIQEVLIALPESSSGDFIRILSLCEPQQVKIKIPPSTQELYRGKPANLVSHGYVQMFSQKLVLWQWLIKRFLDFSISFIALLILSPFILLMAIYIKLYFQRSIFIKIPAIGKNGIPFNLFLFRLTSEDYHYTQNPIYLGTGSIKISHPPILKFLYKQRLYKIPQIFNVLLGDMSIVGPKPEPLEWFQEYGDSIKFLHRRVIIRPGLTGLAQVKYHYELSQKVLAEWIKYDIYYTENMSLRMDLGLLLRTMLLILRGQNGKKNVLLSKSSRT